MTNYSIRTREGGIIGTVFGIDSVIAIDMNRVGFNRVGDGYVMIIWLDNCDYQEV